MSKTLQILPGALMATIMVFAVLATTQTAVRAQTITIALEEVSMPLQTGDYCFDEGPFDRQINVLMSQVGVPVDRDTMGSATVDVEFDNTAWSYQGPGFGDPLPTDLLTVAGAYTIAFDESPGSIRVTILPPAALENLMAGAASVIDGTPFGLVRGLCFDVIPAAASKSAATGVEANITPSSLSAGMFTPPATSGRILSCAGEDPPADYANCVIVNIPGGPTLPVELSSLVALADNEGVVLTWTTESEINNAGFSIEHARGDDTEFAELAFVDGNGTTTDQQTYEFRSTGLDIGRHRFRLRQIDFDGAFEYSEEIEAVIELAGTHRLGSAYPNPFNPTTTFELVVGRDQQVQIDVINALGQRVQRMFDGPMEANEPKNFVFDARMLPTGLYFYRVAGENFAQTRQMLLVK